MASNPTLIFKWLKSENASSQETKKLAKEKGVLLVNGLDFAEMLIDNGLYSLPLQNNP